MAEDFKFYEVGADGKAPDYAQKGDFIVTGGGLYIIGNDDGQGMLVDPNITTYNYKGTYSEPPGLGQGPGPAGGGSGGSSGGSGSSSADALANGRAQANALLNSQKKTQIEGVNTQYDDLVKQAYVTRMQSEKNLKSNLAQTGVTGGLAESTALGIQTDYGNTVSGYEKERASAIQSINAATDQEALQIAIDFADKALAQSNTERSLQMSADQLALSKQRYGIEDARYTDELEYSRKLARAQTLAAAGDFSGYKELGYTDAQIAALEADYNESHKK